MRPYRFLADGLAVFMALTAASSVLAAPSPVPTFDSAKVTIDVTSGPLDTAVRITGTGFPANEIVALYLDSPAVYLAAPGPRSDDQGMFSESIRIPHSTPGPHVICGDTSHPVLQQYAAKACIPFTVTALSASSPSPAKTPLGTSGLPLPIVLLAIGILVGLAMGAALWRR